MNDPLRYIKIFCALALLGLCFMLGNVAYGKVQEYIKSK